MIDKSAATWRPQFSLLFSSARDLPLGPDDVLCALVIFGSDKGEICTRCCERIRLYSRGRHCIGERG